MNKIRVMSAGAVEGPVTELAPKFTQAKGCDVELSFNTVGALKQRFTDGEKTDVIILSFPAIEALEADGPLRPSLAEAEALQHRPGVRAGSGPRRGGDRHHLHQRVHRGAGHAGGGPAAAGDRLCERL